jgi:hypothetical protein
MLELTSRKKGESSSTLTTTEMANNPANTQFSVVPGHVISFFSTSEGRRMGNLFVIEKGIQLAIK